MAWAQREVNNALSMNDLMEKAMWAPDDSRDDCYVCSRHFSKFRRKHHCRLCGEVVCASCLLKKLVEETTRVGLREVKVCMTCLSSTNERQTKPSSSSLSSSSSKLAPASHSSGAIEPHAKHAMDSSKSIESLAKAPHHETPTIHYLDDDDDHHHHATLRGDDDDLDNFRFTVEYELDYNWVYPWPRPPTLRNESERLDALRALRILDTPRDDGFDSICELATNALQCPIGVISFMDDDRQWFKACIGLTEAAIPRDIAFCAHTIRSQEAMVVPDTTKDPRFVQNPLVTGPTHIRFYAGAPLIAPTFGQVIGTICVMDTVPHPRCEVATLEKLSTIVMKKIALSSASTSANMMHGSARGSATNLRGYSSSSVSTVASSASSSYPNTTTDPPLGNLESMMLQLLSKAAETQHQLATQQQPALL
ncbi:hypothetical protein SPRG_21649 [Saprolegnia parasitica CBS 223.65]|uniref:FYVE-type domain-containing protein n=1 Tax=Saprolegnia parasitica (strain CBS 223.65) TaxID=695850 RepID=A0A067BKK8_SAPPC|nr:hypothetical protein SPRG_21649 [Saprolegnia parasitica CBS 223.65]KDO18698.1 hypothetical protein SPRG_21649 [Saprolegnia parasitica CBS 223.65]|eukprot:XP_012210591.1 hypothetical protein SPRG_21649 [Saprolegnia parasitica CBS 223.65]